eukprot:CAMPEP_0204531380 /NCGR_PEP_ID=MMETSP0661-20131031/11139_1 /ASSEMBLY_ACC=CAM_ASM_000606 /TAXON_ID=109239 /ORGANISM="Alexandrium margalefi, Strain AMGDE01CS-322" /LENGTH=187 /DNA_ID=CAMNT_0051537531 /DNA_START=1 /DNA_END=561 /DNA_ORIENTATION=-
MAGRPAMPEGPPAPTDGPIEEEVVVTKNTFLHVVTPTAAGARRREHSAPPSSITTSNSSQTSMSESSAIFERMDQMLQPGGAGPPAEEDAEDSESEQELPASSVAGTDCARDASAMDGGGAEPRKRIRACKGKRDRYKRFLNYAERSMRENADDFDLEHLSVPGFIRKDPPSFQKLMDKLAALQASL